MRHAFATLDWRPSISLEEGLGRTIAAALESLSCDRKTPFMTAPNEVHRIRLGVPGVR
jgi:hypothetical protein